jgi:tape measure domain
MAVETASLIIKVDSRGAKSASADLDRLTDASGKAERATDGLSRAWRAAAGVLSAAAVARVTRAYLDAADAAANMSARLRLATKSQEEFTAAQEATFRIAQSAGTELEGVVNLYGRLAQSSAQLGLSQAQVAQLTETVTQAFIVSGATSQEAAGGIRQLTQALAGGTVRAEEFNSIIESSPRIVQALADHFGVSFGEVRKLVNEGKISSEQFAAAMLNASDKIGAEFRQMPLTVSRATQEVRNALMQLVGSADEAAGASAGLAETIAGLARTLESPEVQRGFQTFVGGVVTATSKLAEFLAKSAEVTRFWGEEFAARRHGASFDDPVRMEQEAERIQARIDELNAFLSKGRVGRALSGLGRADPYAVGRDPTLGRAGGSMVDNAEREMEILLARLNELRKAIADFYNTPRPTVTAPDVPAPSASLIPASLGGSDKTISADLQREIDKVREQAAAYGLSRLELAKLNQEKALAAARNDAEREAIRNAYGELIKRIQVTEAAAEASKAAKKADEEWLWHEEYATAARIDYSNKLIRSAQEREEAEERATQQVRDLIAQMEFENSLIGKSVEEQERLIAARLAGAGATEEQREAIRRLLKEGREGREAEADMQLLRDGAKDLFRTIVTDSARATDALNRFFDILKARAADKLFEGLLSGFAGMAGGGGWSGFLQGFGKGWSGARAAGGPVMAGSAYLVGEHGPELFAPGQSGRVYPVGGAAGGTNVKLEVINNGPPMRAEQQTMRAPDGSQVIRLVLNAVADDLAHGGKTAAAIKGRFGLREATS